jgi:hypothetical protein
MNSSPNQGYFFASKSDRSQSINAAAIYLWAIAHSSGSDGIRKMFVRLQAPPYQSGNIYGVAVTESGLRFLQRWGFRPVVGHPRKLFRYIRLANRAH